MTRHARLRARILATVLTICVPGAVPATAQSLSWSVTVGAGHTGWSGPYEAGGQWTGTLIVVSAERKLSRHAGARLEFGGAISQADAGGATTLEHTRTQLGPSVRAYPWGRDGKWAVFADAGAAIWLGGSCEIHRPSPLLGKRLECRYWEPDPDDGGGPFHANGSGITPFIGAGLRHRAFGLGLRYDVAGPAMFENRTGALTGRTLQITLEWVFRRAR